MTSPKESISEHHGRKVSQVYGTFGSAAITEDGKVFPTLGDAIEYLKQTPKPVPENNESTAGS